MRKTILLALLGFALAAFAQEYPYQHPIGDVEAFVEIHVAMPTGVAVSHEGPHEERVFVNFPRWGDDVPFTVGEIKHGKAEAYPNEEINRADLQDAANHFISVQSVVIDPKNRLWALDSGAPNMGPTVPNGPKLVEIDLKTNKVIKKILFPPSVALKNSYLNDVRFDLKRGKEGMAFITDSSGYAIIVVDLATGESFRRLSDNPTLKPDPQFVPIVEARRMKVRPPNGPAQPFKVGVDGIAISPDGKTLYYCPLSSRHLYSVSVDALVDKSKSDALVAQTIKDLGEKGASDGLDSDAEGRVYASDYEHNAIYRRNTDGTWETLAYDPQILWPDTLCVANDNYLYFIVNQLDRMPRFHNGKDERIKPYILFRIKNEAKPVMAK